MKSFNSAVFVERIEAAVERGVLDIIWELRPKPEPTVSLTDGELARLMIILFPDQYPDELGRPQPTQAPPGSRRKVAEMRQRAARGVAICDPRDATLNGLTPSNKITQGTRTDLGLIRFDND